jgi:ornithine cyclodeaminase/alanine dehydrogenase-like protein (mu-crystallin family)
MLDTPEKEALLIRTRRTEPRLLSGRISAVTLIFASGANNPEVVNVDPAVSRKAQRPVVAKSTTPIGKDQSDVLRSGNHFRKRLGAALKVAGG